MQGSPIELSTTTKEKVNPQWRVSPLRIDEPPTSTAKKNKIRVSSSTAIGHEQDPVCWIVNLTHNTESCCHVRPCHPRSLRVLTTGGRTDSCLRSSIPPPHRPPQDCRFLQISLVQTGSSQERKKEDGSGLPWLKKKRKKNPPHRSHELSLLRCRLAPPPPSQRCLLQAPSIRPIDPVSPWCGTCLFRGLSEKDGSADVMYLGFFQRQPRPWGTLQGELLSGIRGGNAPSYF